MAGAAAAFLLMLQSVTEPAPVPAPVPAAATPAPRAAAAGPADMARIVAAAGLPALGGDAFRFTDIAPGGTVATLFDARRTAGATQRTIVTLSGAGGDWTVDTRETKRLAAETFDYMSARIATALAAGGAPAPCPDGSDYLAERAAGGSVAALRGCGPDHPNIALARLFGVRDTP